METWRWSSINSRKIASTEWLTSVLTRNGYLKAGQVVEVAQTPANIEATLTSQFLALTLTYSSDSTGDFPSHCLMKMGRPEIFQVAQKEAAFYELVRSTDQSKALLKPFGSSVDDSTQSVVILLQDMRGECHGTEWPIPPTFDEAEHAVRALAVVHATWWNSPLLGTSGFERLTDRYVNLPNDTSTALLHSFSTRLVMRYRSHDA